MRFSSYHVYGLTHANICTPCMGMFALVHLPLRWHHHRVHESSIPQSMLLDPCSMQCSTASSAFSKTLCACIRNMRDTTICARVGEACEYQRCTVS